jgi:glutamate dehydrogenase
VPTQPEQAKAEVLERIVATIHDRLPSGQAEQVESFTRQFYRGVDPEDLLERAVPDLYGAVLAQWGFARQRVPGVAKVRVYSPRFEEHGWRSVHSVVEIVTDDMPFLVDSVSMELNRQGLTIHLPIHPVLTVRRDDTGALLETLPEGAGAHEGLRESVIHVEVDRQTEPVVLERVRGGIERVLADVRAASEDWAPMRERVREILTRLADQPPPVDREELAEARALLEWVDQGHFTFLGYRVYDLEVQDGEDILRPVPGTGLGILRETAGKPLSRSFAKLPPQVRRLAREPHMLVLTKANSHATVHRASYLDYIGVKRFDSEGRVTGEWRFLGLYTAAAYNRNPRDIPVLRQKVDRVLQRAGLPPGGHDWKALLNILETFPREELFQIAEDQLFDVAMGILRLEERRRVRLFLWRDRYSRFVSCLAYVPRDRYTTPVRRRIEETLKQAMHGESIDFKVRLSESVLARLYFIVRVPPGGEVDVDVRELEAKLVEATRSWSDELHDAILERQGEEVGNQLFARYAGAFPAAYREDFPARGAVYDIQRLEELAGGQQLSMSLYRPLEALDGALRLKLFWSERPLPLSSVVPMLEAMGVQVVDERPYEVRPPDVAPRWIQDIGLAYRNEAELDLHEVRERFQEAFTRTLHGEAESDGFNQLVLAAGLTWREIVVLRACCRYLRQTGLAFSQSYMEEALAANPAIARMLLELFRARFDPDAGPAGRGDPQAPEGPEDPRRGATGDRPPVGQDWALTVADLERRIHGAIDAVANLDQDRILRAFLTLLKAMTRTNFFQRGSGGEPRPYLAFKLDPAAVPSLPRPRPMFEIFVYSPRTEAVHLRGGRVARGGIRWSDRREDFRTEILGLMKAQMVKNAVIVPTGAKGGFVVKRPPAPQEGAGEARGGGPVGRGGKALSAEVVACYETFIRGLLDLTDNRVDGRVVPPPRVVRYDGDDPYLVVAADKGTATFSDLANSIAVEYGFWLDDAFASGGSTGYDHKGMGITAHGAWESVKRHFRELGVDVQRTDFTVVGIGDMSGDVFGNGMLLSRHLRLVGAFNHLHVFLDPEPGPEASFRERERLFHLSGSSWEDYDRSVISAGGGVWPRSAKSVPLSAEARRALGVGATALTPNELISAMLRAPVDLLWNGGIGTYVKAAAERHADVGDRANDAVRVDASELRCRVVVEGGNLGFTQLGRIEYALSGGRINTDFIDNSGGVDTSDHEVNIKILLSSVVAAGDMTRKQRDLLLAEMRDGVAEAVLLDNYRQVQALSITAAHAPGLLEEHARQIRRLERAGVLDRRLEFLPSDDELAERGAARRGLTRPELAVLLAYSKVMLKEELLASDVPEDPYLSDDLERYLPAKLRERFRPQVRHHPLRREIIATYVTNSMINRVGSTFMHRLHEETGATGPDTARAYTVAREVFDVRRLWTDIGRLDDAVPATVQTALMTGGRRLVERATRWLLRNRHQPLDIAAVVSHFAPGIAALAQELPKLLAPADSTALRRAVERFAAEGVPTDLATRVASLDVLHAGLDVIEVASALDETVEAVAAVYFALGARLDLHWLRGQVGGLAAESHWQALAQAAMRDDLASEQRHLTAQVLRHSGSGLDAEAVIEAWLSENRAQVGRYQAVLEDLKQAETLDVAMLTVALREIRNLAQSAEQVSLPRPGHLQ